MAYSIQRDVSNGSLQYLEVRIDYFAKEHLSVFIAEKVVPQGTTPDPTSGYCWTWDGNRIKFNKAVANGLEVMVRRATPIDAPFHIFRQGAVFKDLTVDENFLQQLYINQENQEGQTTTDFYSDLNFHGYRLRNVGAAIHDYDAVPFSQYRADALGAMQQRILAEQARDTAVSAKDTSVAAKTAAEAARDAALVSQNAAKTSETNAKNSENAVVPLVPVVDKAVKDAAAASAQAASAAAAANQAVIDVKNLGAVPIGAVLAFIKEPLPAGYLALRGGKFDKLTYPDLFTLLGTDDLPDFTDRVPKMVGSDLTLLEKQGWCWPQHSHTWGGQTDTQGAHSHNRGSMEISGQVSFAFNNGGGSNAIDGAFGIAATGKKPAGSFDGSGYATSADFYASRTWTGETSNTGAHTHHVSGTTSQAGNSDHVDVDRIGVIYAIKAAGVLSNEGMAQIDGVLNRVGALEYVALQHRGDASPNLNNVTLHGIYHAVPTGGIPFTYGTLIVYETVPGRGISQGNWITQKFIGTNYKEYSRQHINLEGWTPWAEVYDSRRMTFEF